MKPVRLAVLGNRGMSTKAIVNALIDDFDVVGIVIESPPPATKIVMARIRRLGLSTVIGQLLFQIIVVPLLRVLSFHRRRELIKLENLRFDELPQSLTYSVRSANAPDAISILQRLAPDVVVVSGTRILSEKVLTSINALFLNIHAGITPQYRGVHGGYWALAAGDRANFGVTVHILDCGVDTGTIIDQARLVPGAADNFTTYPLLQLGRGVPLLKDAIRRAVDRRVIVAAKPLSSSQSRLWSHPTIGEYLKGLARGVR